MYDTLNAPIGQSLRQLSGEQLLLLAVLGSGSLKPKIDRELDRRAVACAATPRRTSADARIASTAYAA